jgi:predicted nucleotidyltransferase
MVTPVATLEEAVVRLRPRTGDLRALGVARLALFGSVSTGKPRADSDADFLVSFAPGQKSYARFLEVAELLETVLGRSVELVTPESLSPILAPKILADAQDVIRAA